MSESPRRGQRTRYDKSRRNTLIAIIAIAVIVIGGALFSFIRSQRQDAEAVGALRRNQDVRPRNTDMWFIYPDNSVRFVALFYPADEQALYSVAGPLLTSAESVVAQEPLNATFSTNEILESPGEDDDLVFSLYELNYTGNGDDPYGINVLTTDSAYLSEANFGQLLLLGNNAQTQFQQVVVAVGFPTGTEVTVRDLSLTPYRERKVQDWDVYYFDTGAAAASDAIRLEFFNESSETPREPDIERIDRQR